MRVNGQQVARTWTQFESQMPQWNVEPVSVEVKQNDTKIEGYPVFETLVKLSGLQQTPDEILAGMWLEVYTNKEWEQKFIDKDWGVYDWFMLCFRFLKQTYHNRRAYIKVGDIEYYWQVEVLSRKFRMKTPEWVLLMPSMFINDVFSFEHKYVFFPASALLSEWEQALFETYRYCSATNETKEETLLEREIMRLLEQLIVARENPPKIQNCTKQFNELEEMCRNSGTIKKLSIENKDLVLSFDWRVAMDSDREVSWMVLPPVELRIDLRNFTVRGNHTFHPHIMRDNTLCMWGVLTDLAHKCIQNRDLKTLVGGMIDFGNSWTSSDVTDSSRHPSDCIIRYYQNGPCPDWENLPVTIQDIKNTLDNKWYDYSELGEGFSELVNNI